jgi:HPt (histidine-containing phosphotransfer) domain-containing protein
MAGIPKVKITFDADFDDLKKGIKGSQAEVETFADKVGEFGKKAAIAFGIAAAAIGAFALASVKAAAEDETAQKKLEETLRNTTDATAEQIKGIDKYITRQSIATATTDNEIRPALSRLLLATGDLTKAQELLSLAQEISVARSKPLEAVTNALGKAFEGSNTALGKLGIGIDKATLKTASFDEIQQLLNATFDGFIENQATTAAFKFEQISIAIQESKEAIGAALLPVVKELADFLIVSVVPAIESFVSGLTGSDGLEAGLTETQVTAIQWGKNVRKVIDTVIDLKDELIATAAVIGTIFVVSKIAAGVTATIALIKSLIVAYNLLKASAIVAGIASAFALNPLLGVGAVAVAAAVLAAANALTNQADETQKFAIGGAPGFITGGAASGSVSSSNSGSSGGSTGGTGTTVRSTTPSGITAAVASAAKAGGAFTDSQNAARLAAAGGGGFTDSQNAARINLTVNGALDAEGTARTIVETLNNSFFRGTGGASNLQAI